MLNNILFNQLMEEVETEINFSNILFENESQFLNNSFQS